jgi:hypothetical protein
MKRASTELKKQLQFVMECFKEVQAVGFSTGGLLLHQFLVEQKAPPQFKGVHFISPLFLQRFGGVFDRLIAQFFDGVSVDLAYATTRFRDIKVMTLDPEFYHQNVPMQSGVDIVDTAKEVSQTPIQRKINVLSQLFISDGDLTVDIYAAKKMISRHYENAEVVWYKDHSPHHLMAPSVSSKAQDVRSRIYQSVMGQN